MNEPLDHGLFVDDREPETWLEKLWNLANFWDWPVHWTFKTWWAAYSVYSFIRILQYLWKSIT